MKHKHSHWSYVLLGVFVLALVGVQAFFPEWKQFTNPEYLRQLLLNAGSWGYLLQIGLLLLTIPLPMPSTPVVLAGGYVYGVVMGTILALIAVIIGGTIAFYLTRYFGLPLLEKLVSRKHILQLNHIMKKRGSVGALISYAIPIFPSDAVHMILGLTKMPYFTFLTLCILGHIPRYVIVTSLGEDLFVGFTLRTFLVLLGSAAFVAIALYRETLVKFFFKELHEIEEEVEAIEKDVGIRR